MLEFCEPAHLLAFFPPELLFHIFIYLPAKTLTRCREVSTVWRDIIDVLSRNDKLWRRNCKDDFNKIYEVARRKSKPGVPWFELYRSMSIWRLLKYARDERNRFSTSFASPLTEIRNFKVLRDGIVGVLQDGSINYYDIETLALANRPPLLGDYTKYTENDNFIIILSFHLHLHIIPKAKYVKSDLLPALTYNNVKQFALIDHKLYFVSYHDDIFVCDMMTTALSLRFMGRLSERVMSIGVSNGHFNVLTFQRKILTYEKDTFIVKANLSLLNNLLRQLQKYQLLNHMDWRIYFQWMYELNTHIPNGPLKDIKVVKHYGNVYLVGSYWGILRIYYSECSDEDFDVMTTRPIKRYSFMRPEDRTPEVLCMCPILQIDAMEQKDGHIVVVAMPRQIVVVKFTHDFNATTTRKFPQTTLSRIQEYAEEEEESDSDLSCFPLYPETSGANQ